MSRKDYVAFAKMIRDLEIPEDIKAELIREICRVFIADNPRFSKDRFESACRKSAK